MERNEQFYITAGFNAFRLGKTSFDCPFGNKTPECKAWLIGYTKAKQAKAARFEVNPIIIRRPIALRSGR